MKIHPTLRLGLIALLLAVPLQALTTLSLVNSGESGTVNGATFTQIPGGIAGTGLIDSFVRIQQNGGEDGFNATARPVMTNVHTDPNFTRDIRLGDVPIVNGSYQFLLDINQTLPGAFLSLDQVRVFTRDAVIGPLASASSLLDLTGALGIAQRYTMDPIGGDDNTITLNYALNSGSGRGDYFMYIPTSFFMGDLSTDFVYLYSQFGTFYPANDGFEEWSVLRSTPVATPDNGSAIILLGLGLATLALLKRRIR